MLVHLILATRTTETDQLVQSHASLTERAHRMWCVFALIPHK